MISYRRLGRYGALGNQMFQIASTIGIAKKYNREYLFPKWEYSEYFQSQLEDKSILLTGLMMERINEYELHKIPMNHYVDLQGYYQNEKYFKHYKEDIRKLFTPNKEVHYKIIKRYPNLHQMTSIHVRRGDYLDYPDHHPNLTMDYYKRAMDILEGPYIICSDDIEWCKENFKDFSNITFVEDNWKDIYDMILMSYCKSHIIANSSFSWWSAWLSGNKTVCSQNWWGEKAENKSNIICDNWIKIKN